MKKIRTKFKETEIRPIPEEWEIFKLEKLVDRVVDNRGKTPPLSKSGYELLEVNAIKTEKRLPDYSEVEKFVDNDTYINWFRAGHIQVGDILIPTVGTIGSVAISLENRGSIAQNLIALRINKRCEPLFLYYLLSAQQYREQIHNLDIGGVQPSIKVPHLLNLDIVLPKINEQKRIAEILGALDEKIELNRRMNDTLEKIANAVFKHWFVDFNFPNEQGKPYKSTGGKMIDSELGLIPKGWRVGKLGEIITLNYGKALKGENRNDGNIKVYGSSGFVGFHNRKLVTGPGIVIGRKGNVGSVYWVDSDFYSIDTTYFVESKLPLVFCYYLLKNQNFINGDSVVPGLNREQAYLNQIILPDKITIENFSNNSIELRNRIAFIEKQNNILSQIRDSLLPRLMSGRIRINI